MKKIKAPIHEVRRKTEDALVAHGASIEDARIVADDYIDADLRGRESHGLASLKVALGQFPKQGEFKVVDRGPAHLTIDGNGDCGHIVARASLEVGSEIASESGICAIGIRSITRFACPGTIARLAAEKNLISLVWIYGGQNFLAPPGGKTASLSTNPIAMGMPVSYGSPFVLDVATSSRAIGYVGLAKLANEAIPSDWAIGDDGMATTDPHAVKAVTPFGGYKGYGLSLAFEILSGVLVGVPVGSGGTLANRGALIILIKPDIFGIPRDIFAVKVSEFLNEVISTPAIDGAEIYYPGQQADRRRDEALKSGMMELPEAVLAELESVAEASSIC